ncbi:hypothetical protein GCM10010965_12420 [Caldalkalibacillus thermarum]|nr:hypothetical protein GCM10010965_12420 [Caldalkalibacillus thermarum]
MELSVSLFCINASALAGEMDHHPMIRLVRKNYRKDTFICLTYPKQDIGLEWFHQASDIRQACCQISQYRVKVWFFIRYICSSSFRVLGKDAPRDKSAITKSILSLGLDFV